MSWDVTGMGAVASVGRDTDELFAALCAGRSGVNELRGFDHSRYSARHAYEVDDRPGTGTDVPRRATALLIDAIGQAARDAGLDEKDLGGIPVLIGTGLRELRSVELWQRDGVAFGAGELHFGTALRAAFGADDTHTFSNACSAGLYALALGTDLLTRGAADTVIVAGVDVLTETMYGLLERVQPVPPERVRPFDRNRAGVLMGEGAAAVVLKRVADAGTPVHGRVRSVAINCDAFHVTAPDPVGIATAIREAHTRAGVKPKDIDLVMVHGTGTLLNDETEAIALADVFGPDADKPLMTATKSMTGHTSGASGLLNLVVALRALAEGRIPPTVGLDDPVDEAAGFRFVTGEAVHASMTAAQLNAFGFGGVNAVAIVEAVR
ncbi:3-oxoacyl-ACP synthase [Streptomyces sp. SCA3-4]|uniref:beta-ketoacyl-[acyl-carrier-protein] synthase family protein n=1 Tax=Streptomyces sichuanensis TaxID=2871810 RepID=UPI001CE31217|nr:beta-ketoacyl synthase N-terminal-like domain-containing protein [Streptomyces sichuanensis]MCA6094684.1 3-oxoacyl-ACP synthase [Streptomyces sichuanensis]